jgi:hypothetical protein
MAPASRPMKRTRASSLGSTYLVRREVTAFMNLGVSLVMTMNSSPRRYPCRSGTQLEPVL